MRSTESFYKKLVAADIEAVKKEAVLSINVVQGSDGLSSTCACFGLD